MDHDLQFVENAADIIVVLANRPGYGTAIEMYIAKNSNKKVILLAIEPVPILAGKLFRLCGLK